LCTLLAFIVCKEAFVSTKLHVHEDKCSQFANKIAKSIRESKTFPAAESPAISSQERVHARSTIDSRTANVRGSIARKIAVPQFPRQRQIKRKKKKKKRKKKKRKKKKGKNTDQPQAGVAASNIGSRGASAVMIESPQEGGKRAREGGATSARLPCRGDRNKSVPSTRVFGIGEIGGISFVRFVYRYRAISNRAISNPRRSRSGIPVEITS